jgi:glucosamine--fructose-6-phosphate aminotransferase (isomerizing)
MCGIFAYTNAPLGQAWDVALEIALNGIKRLEYRGYDSAGVGAVFSDGGAKVIKSRGNVVALQKECLQWGFDIKATCIIAHTRWATHGQASTRNAHPHVSDDNNTFMVVHNGIITNAIHLRMQLAKTDVYLTSETDSEVIPKLLKQAWDANPRLSLAQIVAQVVPMLQGNYAFVVASPLFPGALVGCRGRGKGSPLLFGCGENGECVVSSDAISIIEYTDCIYALGDEEIVVLENGTWDVYVANTMCLAPEPQPIATSACTADFDLGTFQSYLEKEIFTQPASIASTIRRADLQVPDQLLAAKSVVMVGCGTSLHACMACKEALRSALKKVVVVECASSFVDEQFPVGEKDVCIFVSQSGETADTLAALSLASQNGAFCLAITNCPGSALVRAADASIFLHAGNEVSVASTKAYTSQVLLMHMLAAKIEGRQLSALNCMEAVVSKTLQTTNKQVLRILPWVLQFDHILLIGRSSDFATCVEGALKIKEVPYIHAEAILAGELKHGPLALIDDRVLVIVIATGQPKMKSVIEQLQARGALLLIIACDKELPEFSCDIRLQRSPVPELQALLNVIPLQLLAVHLAKIKKTDLDRPRNLAKSVTVKD